MILPQHKRKRVELDDQEKKQVVRFMITAHKTRQAVKLRMYHEYEDAYVIGVVERIDSLTARFRVDGEWFYMEDITALGWDD
ncbi:YolD-like family protein [Paenibacillus lentus]|uniref:YolD-like family protein n=1 Tax=Paenibacillus lentus TaxID=1338368 RepID=UPI0036D3A3D4